MRIAMRSTSAGTKDIERAFALIGQAGADGIEVSYASPKAFDNWSSHAKELAKLSAKCKLPVPSLNLTFLCNAPYLIQTGALSNRGKQAVLDALTIAAAIKAGVVLVPFFGKNAIELEKELSAATEILAELVEGAEEVDVVLGIESTLNTNQQQFMLDQLGNSPCAKIYYDTGDVAARKLDVASGIRDLGADRIAQVHIKDVCLIEGKPPDFDVALGEGNIDFRAVANALQAVGFDGWAVLETPPSDDALASAKRNISFARDLFSPTQ